MPHVQKLAALSAALIVGLSYANAQQPAATQPDMVVQAGRLLADPATGSVLTQQSILVRAGRVVSVTPGYSAPDLP